MKVHPDAFVVGGCQDAAMWLVGSSGRLLGPKSQEQLLSPRFNIWVSKNDLDLSFNANLQDSELFTHFIIY